MPAIFLLKTLLPITALVIALIGFVQKHATKDTKTALETMVEFLPVLLILFSSQRF